MILKIKKNDFNWMYIETTKFEIHQSYDDKELVENIFSDCGMSYTEAKETPIIKFKNEPKKPLDLNSKKEDKDLLKKEQALLKTLIFTDKVTIEWFGDFVGFVLNDKGQTIERL